MPHFSAIVAYDGTDFFGFQRQAQARTVQGDIEAALRRLGWSDNSLLAAGRTDAGVHASGQVIAFALHWSHSQETLLKALNAHLPTDVAVTRVAEVSPDFHPRYRATARRYRYTWHMAPTRHPLLHRFAWRVWPALDATAMQAAANTLLGTRDFATFGTNPGPGLNTVRTVYLAQLAQDGAHLYFDIQANAFLFRMVRSIVGALTQVGQHRLSVAEFQHLLTSANRALCPKPAPAHGLCLTEVFYSPV